MSEVAQGVFSCPHCGKRYNWKPQLAGRSSRCKCGGTVHVPAVAPGGATVNAAVTAIHRAAPVAAPRPIDYRNVKPQRDADARMKAAMHSPVKDLYGPLGLLVAGMVLLVTYTLFAAGMDGLGLAVVAVIVGVEVLVKTVVLIGVGFAAAAIFGAYFGTLWTAILKFAAIVLFTESCFAWFDHLLGGGGGIGFRGFTMFFLLQAAFIGIQCYMLFEFDAQDTLKIGGALALGMRAVDIAVVLTLSAIFEA